MIIAPVSAIIATRDRAESLSRTLESLLTQNLLAAEFIAIDASKTDATRNLISEFQQRLPPAASVRWIAAAVIGAAPQRNQGVALASQPFIWFFDDDILLEPDCVSRLWKAIESDATLGGVNAMIINQRYEPPGLISRTMFTLMHGRPEKSFAGKVIGPAVNLLPEDRQVLPEVVPVEWLNTTCTIYRRETLPDPPFDPFFEGYSLMEDLALSLRVARKWRLANVRTARIRHESQSAAQKANTRECARIELLTRYYVMSEVLGRSSLSNIVRLALFEAFQVCCTAWSQPRGFKEALMGKLDAVRTLWGDRRHPAV